MSRLYRFADLIVAFEDPLPELPTAPPGRVADVVVTRGTGAPVVADRWFQTWTAGRARVRFGRAGHDYVVAFKGVADVAISAAADRVELRPARGISDFRARHLLLHQVLPLVASRRGHCVLHASAVSWRDRIVAFVGRTGAGKSTIAAACATLGASLVTDDSLVLDRSAGEWRAVPSYPGLRLLPRSLGLVGRATTARRKTREDDKILLTAGRDLPAFEERTLPLARLFLLSPRLGARPLPAGRGGAAVTLASQLFRLDVEDRAESRRLFDEVTDLATTVPILRMRARGRADDVRRLARAALDAD